MPSAYLKFKLPDENDEFQLALDAGKIASAVYELAGWLRDQEKYHGNKPFRPSTVRQKLFEFFEDAKDYIQ